MSLNSGNCGWPHEKSKWLILIYSIFITLVVGILAISQVYLQPLPATPLTKTPDELRVIAETGSAEDQYDVGVAYETGRGVSQSL